jgi:hypothetical protein
MTDPRAMLPGVLAYADMFNKSAFTQYLSPSPAAAASSSPKTRRTEGNVALSTPPLAAQSPSSSAPSTRRRTRCVLRPRRLIKSG